MKLQTGLCFLLLILFSCNSNNKKEFLDQAIKENLQQKNYTLVGYAIDSETSKNDITILHYHATVNQNSKQQVIADSISYALTGDGVYTSQ